MRTFSRTLGIAGTLVGLWLAGPGCDDHGHGDTPQACVTDHAALSEVEAIAECLTDELALTFTTQMECEAYVEANGGFSNSRVAACELYFGSGTSDAGTSDAAPASSDAN